jgi:internalin A
MARVAAFGLTLVLGAWATLALAGRATAQSDPDPKAERIGNLRAKVKRAADRPGQPIVAADLTLTDADDDDLTALEELTELRELDLSFTRVTDAGLSHLAGLKSLQSVHLAGLGITDTGLARLKALPALRELVVFGMPVLGGRDQSITDAGLAHLKGLRTLESLHFASAGITDDGLVHPDSGSCRSAGRR